MHLRRIALAVLLCGLAAPVAAAPLAVETAVTTPKGASFAAPAEWTLVRRVDGAALTAPEGDLTIGVIDVGSAKDADAAVAAAWARVSPGFKRPVRSAVDAPGREGWDAIRRYQYIVPPEAKRVAYAIVHRRGDQWSVLTAEGSEATFDKRLGALGTLIDTFRPAGYVRESFAGRRAHTLTPERIEAMKRFVAEGMAELGIPGAAIAFVDRDRILWAGGLGVRAVGRSEAVTERTRFLVASNTKSMATLLLAQMVDDGRLAWDQSVVSAWPGFRLATPEATQAIRVRHLMCACTGLPRQDALWYMASDLDTPASLVFDQLAMVQPTSGFGDIFQYSNLLAAAAGYVGARAAHPDMEVGAAFDRAMRERVFEPLGMTDTTFDFRPVMAGGDVAAPHEPGRDGGPRLGRIENSVSIHFARPAGGAWSSARDMALYVQNELREGVTPAGKRIVSAKNLLVRRAPGVKTGEDLSYGLGLETSTRTGVAYVHHGGAMPGYKTNFVFLPDAGVGAVILTNSDSGRLLLDPFTRRLLELLYDGKSEAEGDLKAAAASLKARLVKDWSRLTIPADRAAAARLAAAYRHPAAGRIDVRRADGDVVFDFGPWESRMASRREEDGTLTFVAIDPTTGGFEMSEKPRPGGPSALVLREAQSEYLYAPER